MLTQICESDRLIGDAVYRRMLCIDDNIDVADSTVELLQTVGYDAVACYNGASALAEASSFHPGVCLIDLNMPGMDGDVLAVRLRKLYGETPIVLVAMTAMSNEESCRRIREAGFDLHLIKPVEPMQLLSAINRMWRLWDRACLTIPD